MQTVDIWNASTGITGLPDDLSTLLVPTSSKVREQFARFRAETDPSDFALALEKLAREWAIETGAIEGLYEIDRGVTVQLIEEGLSLDTIEPGSVNRDPTEVLSLIHDQKAALDFVFDFVTSKRELSVGLVKELHSLLTRSQATTTGVTSSRVVVEVPLLSGEYKQQPNFPTRGGKRYRYCPPEQVASEMDRLLELYHCYDQQDIEPDILACWLHHRFTQIHPFRDGNGRVARALATMVAIKGGLLSFLVTRQDTNYLKVLELADDGFLRPFVRFFGLKQETALTGLRARYARSIPVANDGVQAVRLLNLATKAPKVPRSFAVQGAAWLARAVPQDVGELRTLWGGESALSVAAISLNLHRPQSRRIADHYQSGWERVRRVEDEALLGFLEITLAKGRNDCVLGLYLSTFGEEIDDLLHVSPAVFVDYKLIDQYPALELSASRPFELDPPRPENWKESKNYVALEGRVIYVPNLAEDQRRWLEECIIGAMNTARKVLDKDL
jgi:hypothetical protein